MLRCMISVNASAKSQDNRQSTLGPFPIGIRQMRFLVVEIDYFTKWVEAKPLAKIT